MLGYNDVYHFTNIAAENPRDAEMWEEAMEGKFEGGKPFTREDWDQLLGHCMAVSDAPANIFSKELMDAYPEAKVILSVRDSAEAWHKSWMDSVQPALDKTINRKDIFARFLRACLPHIPGKRLLMQMNDYTEFGTAKEHGIEWYHNHNQWVRDNVAAERLLEFNVKEGWEPLCKFLNKPIPDEPFPFVNEKEEFMRGVQKRRQEFHKMFHDRLMSFFSIMGLPLLALLSWMVMLR